MQDVMKLFTGQLNAKDYYASEVIEFESEWGPSTRGSGELRREHSRRHAAHRSGLRRHQRRPPGQRHSSVQLDR